MHLYEIHEFEETKRQQHKSGAFETIVTHGKAWGVSHGVVYAVNSILRL